MSGSKIFGKSISTLGTFVVGTHISIILQKASCKLFQITLKTSKFEMLDKTPQLKKWQPQLKMGGRLNQEGFKYILSCSLCKDPDF